MVHSLVSIKETLAERDQAKAFLEEKLKAVEKELKATSKKVEEEQDRLKAKFEKARGIIKTLQ